MKSGYQIGINEKNHVQSLFATGMWGVVSRVNAMHLNNVFPTMDGMEKGCDQSTDHKVSDFEWVVAIIFATAILAILIAVLLLFQKKLSGLLLLETSLALALNTLN